MKSPLLDQRESLAYWAIRRFYENRLEEELESTLTTSMAHVARDAADLATSHGVVFLPTTIRGISDECITRHRGDSVELQKLLRLQGVSVVLAPTEEGQLLQESVHERLPEILISAQLVLTSPETIKLLLEVLAGFIKDAISKQSTFKEGCALKVNVMHADGSGTQIGYVGSESGLPDVVEAIKAASKRTR